MEMHSRQAAQPMQKPQNGAAAMLSTKCPASRQGSVLRQQPRLVLESVAQTHPRQVLDGLMQLAALAQPQPQVVVSLGNTTHEVAVHLRCHFVGGD